LEVCARGSAPHSAFHVFVVLRLFNNGLAVFHRSPAACFSDLFFGLRRGLRRIYIWRFARACAGVCAVVSLLPLFFIFPYLSDVSYSRITSPICFLYLSNGIIYRTRIGSILKCIESIQVTTSAKWLYKCSHRADSETIRKRASGLRFKGPNRKTIRKSIPDLRSKGPNRKMIRKSAPDLRSKRPNRKTIRKNAPSLRFKRPNRKTIRKNAPLQGPQGFRHKR